MDLQQLQRLANFFGLGSKPKDERTVKVGVLGASQVATYAMLWPANHVPGAEVVAVAARDGKRAAEYAKQYKIQRSYGSYQELLDDPNVDAVYVGLPNGLHGEWTAAALRAGKHVLCEKPFAANAQEARQVQALAKRKGLLCREAFHYREHPLMGRLKDIVGELGHLKEIKAKVLVPNWVFGGANIRFQETLAGGAMMDAGCYCVHAMRTLIGSEPRVELAAAKLRPPSQVVDGSMVASLSWKQQPGLTGSLHASLTSSSWFPHTEIHVVGDRGSMLCKNFVVPFFGNTVHVKTTDPETGKTKERVEKVYGQLQETTYYHQLERFVTDLKLLTASNSAKGRTAALQSAKEDATDCIANMQVVDDVYTAAQLPLRQPSNKYKV